MSAPSTITYDVRQKDGRRYTVDASGITTLKRDYLVVQSDIMTANGEVVSITGVPAIGSAHPNHPGLVVANYDIAEGTGRDKQTLTVTVNYTNKTFSVDDPSATHPVGCIIDEWGWDEGTDERELTSDVDGVAVVNSAGDPFDSVPKISAPAPVFTKVVRFQARQSGWGNAMCCVNSSQITIGGISFAPGTLLCTVGESVITNSADAYKYKYSIHLRYKSNLVKLEGSESATDIGWDVAITDAGMRAKRTVGSDTKVMVITRVDGETGRRCVVTSPALLNGEGEELEEGGEPYNIRFAAYERASFPSWFYSEA